MTSSTTNPFNDYVGFRDPEDDAYFEEIANQDDGVTEPQVRKPGGNTDSWRNAATTGTALESMNIDQFDWVVDGIIPEGLTILAAPPKAGKSWFVLDIALAAASGGVALSGIDMGAPRPVLHLSLEDSFRRLRDRARQIMGDAPLPREWYTIVDVDPGITVNLIRGFLSDHQGQKPLIIVDVFAKAVASNPDRSEGGYRADYSLMRPWKELCDDHPGAGIILVHHTRKMQADDYLEMVSGSNGIAGACDTVLVLNRERQSDSGTLNVTGRDVGECAYMMSSEGGRWCLEGNNLRDAQDAAFKAKMRAGVSGYGEKIIDALASAEGPLTPSDIAGLTGLERRAVSTNLGRLKDKGRVVLLDRGLYQAVGATS